MYDALLSWPFFIIIIHNSLILFRFNEIGIAVCLAEQGDQKNAHNKVALF